MTRDRIAASIRDRSCRHWPAMVAIGVAIAIPGMAEARVSPNPGEQAMIARDRNLYSTARAYFPDFDFEYFRGNAQDLPPKRLFRLTRDQLDNTVKSLLPRYFDRSVKTAMARDPLQTNYEYAEVLSLNTSNLAPLKGWIGAIAARVRKDPSGVIDCKAAGDTADCLRAAARRFVTTAFRGDLVDKRIDGKTQLDKYADYVVATGKSDLGQAASDLVLATLLSPGFLFRHEIDVDGSNRLKPAQRLQALTYTLADAPPDMLGLKSTDAAQLLGTPLSLDRTIKTILASKPTRQKLERFFRAWLEVREPADFEISSKLFPEFTPQLAQAMLDETNRFLGAALAGPKPSLKDITRANASPVSKDLEAIYKTAGAGPSGGSQTRLDTAQRLGIFSQPAVIASHSGPTDTRPIKRGVFWVRKVMCMQMGTAPKGLDISIKALPHPTTQRVKIEATNAQRACSGCHKLIDPLGFFQEHYDPIGRWRTTDNGFPVDARMTVDIEGEGVLKANGPVEALKALTDTAMFKQCFVRQMFRFYMGRNEEPGDDPLLRRMFFEFAYEDGQDILGLLDNLAASERIQRRR